MRNLPYYDTNPVPPGPPRQDPAPYSPMNDTLRHQLEWQAHVDAGRIGTRTPMPAHIAENIARNERIVLGRS